MSDKKKWSRPAKLSLLAGCLILAVGGYVLTTKLVARGAKGGSGVADSVCAC